MNNQKQLALANIMYCGDFSAFVQPAAANTPYGDQAEWMGTMMSYFAKSTNLLVCPCARNAPSAAVPNYMGASLQGAANFAYVRTLDSSATLYPGIQNFNCSYQYNGWLYTSSTAGTGDGSGDGSGIEGSHNIADPGWFYLKDTAMEAAANTPIFVDGPWVDAWPSENDGPSQDLWTGHYSSHDNEMGRFTILRHGGRTVTTSDKIGSTLPLKGGVNISLADGHAEYTALPHLWSYNWHKAWASTVNIAIGTPQP
jgi:prepilin-type processing-associated H-X9-DG protein